MKKIAVYYTNDLTYRLIATKLEKEIHDDHNVVITPVHARDIQQGILSDKDYIGYVMPGRNHGQDYRSELGEQGFKAIRHAVTDGLSALLICAGSAISASHTLWNNPLDQRSVYKTNPDALFDGIAAGPLKRLWQDGYHSTSSGTDDYLPSFLCAKVVEVTYTLGQTPVTGHALYWGGCALISHDRDSQHHLVRHNAIRQAAVTEFSCGRGLVMASNIHPEIDGDTFEKFFKMTSKARTDKAGFHQDKANLLKSAAFHGEIFKRFADNCLNTKQNYILHKHQPTASLST